jgi:CubicO group peptidase (beta-lactamase class C family)
MIRMKWFVMFCLFLLVSATGVADTDTNAILQEFDTYLDKTANQLGKSPFAAIVSKNGIILYERYDDGQGVLGKPVNAQSRWQVFSITKSFVSALVLGLCEDELLSLDDPVAKYLPSFREHGDGPFDRQVVTIRHLMSHTSGAAVDGDKTPNPLPTDLGSIEIITEPGTGFKYSGLGMLILERTLEAATGKDFDALLNERVTGPLGLESTGYVYAGLETEQVLPLKKDLYHYSLSGKRAGAGLFTTARDLNSFGQFWLNPDSMFSRKLRAEAWTYHGMRESDGGRYGLLWWLFESNGGYVMSGKDNKINAVIPETSVVITVIRYPQARAAKDYKFTDDKRAMVLFGKRL